VLRGEGDGAREADGPRDLVGEGCPGGGAVGGRGRLPDAAAGGGDVDGARVLGAGGDGGDAAGDGIVAGGRGRQAGGAAIDRGRSAGDPAEQDTILQDVEVRPPPGPGQRPPRTPGFPLDEILQPVEYHGAPPLLDRLGTACPERTGEYGDKC